MTRGPLVAQNSEWEHFPISIPIVAPVGVEDKLQLSCSQAFLFPPPYLRLPPPPSPRQWGRFPQAVPFGSTTPYPEPHCEIIDIAIFIMGVYALGYNLQRQKGVGGRGTNQLTCFSSHFNKTMTIFFSVAVFCSDLLWTDVLSCRLSAIVYIYFCHKQGGVCCCLSNNKRDVFIFLKGAFTD